MLNVTQNLIFGFVVIVSPLFGVVREPIDELRPISVTFSTISHNRIAIEDGAVEKVFGDSSIFAVTLDPITGNAFINVMQNIGKTPATLSIITSTGLVQDLLISSREGASEQLFLREKQERLSFHQDASMARTADVFNRIIEGKIPFGYGQTDVKEPLILPAPLQSEVVKTLEGPFELITVYRIVNHGAETIVLSAEALKRQNSSWSFLNVRELGQGEEAICLLGSPKDEREP